ncbi:SusC/RagA family TonB-linked outer membrane protein [Nibribacter koreensis]|uniref:SusC/RagA family TonB-linked outer membrane protein n=1 Tax=Nibribacter koreensis TaxID=1084519 RepID=A0ABP8FID0_9BACT
MKKILLLSLFLLSVLLNEAMAQNRTITGRVTDAGNNEGLPGVTVLVKGTSNGASTDANGNFQLSIPAGNATLVFNYIGYVAQERAVGNSTTINVALSSDTKVLQEVVVTALGESREKETLPYSVGVVSGNQLTLAKSNDVSSSLAGKVSGVQLQGSPSSTFDNASIVIRGANSILPGNPLYVVDGVITEQQNVIMDNVANISVLKGAAATALYGNRAANGVVIITSKKGEKGKTTVELNLSATAEKLYLLPPYQNSYAGGYTSSVNSPASYGAGPSGNYLDEAGNYIFRYDPDAGHPAEWAAFDGQKILEYGADESWGPKITGQTYRPWYSWYPGEDFGKQIPMTAQPDNIRDFFETGMFLNNSIAFSGASDAVSYRLTYANQHRTLTIPEAKRNQHQLGLNSSFTVSPKITVTTDATFTYTDTKGAPAEDYRNDGLNVTQGFNQWFQRQLNLDDLRNYRTPDGRFKSWNIGDPNASGDIDAILTPQYWESPYFVQENNFTTQQNTRLSGNLGLNYKLTDHLSVQGNAKMFYRGGRNDGRIAFGSIATPQYTLAQFTIREFNYEGYLNYKREFGDFSFDGFVGTALRLNDTDIMSQTTQGGLSAPDYFDISASVARPLSTRTFEEREVRSLLGRASVGYKGFLFLDGTLRNDWFSTLPTENNSFMYGSLGGSLVFTELLNNESLKRVLSSGKLRGSVAQAGQDIGFNQVNIVNNNEVAYGNNSSASVGNQYRSGQIKPALTTSWEVGADFRFFNRFGLDFTYYNDVSEDQILGLEIDPTTGYNTAQVNAGKFVRTGIELSLNGTAVQTDNFTWDVMINWSKNRSRVDELVEGVTTYLVGTDWNNTRLEHRAGQDWGMLVGRRWRRNDQGQILVGANGVPQYDIGQERGSVQPDFTGGVFNSFSYKGFNLGFSLDFQKGGLFYSSTKQFNLGGGLHEATVGLNDKGNDWRDYPSNGGGYKIPNAVFAPGTPKAGQPNDVYMPARRYFYTSLQAGAIDEFVLDGSYLKLREVRLGYEVPKSILGTLPISGANISFIVNNAWLISAPAKEYGIDPSELEDYWTEGGQLSSTRSMGVNLRLTF